jgi:hypothetical protein
VPVVPHDPLFDSAWLKWAQAVVHSQTLQRDVEARAGDPDPDPVGAFRTEYQPHRHGFAVIVERVAPIPVGWRLLLGDIANNYRAALDHLAWALVSRGRTPPCSGALSRRQEKAVYFPIFEHRAEYNGALARNLPGVRRADAAKVRWCQPYHRSTRTRPRHPLALLAGINARDKHRTIQPLWAFPTRLDIEVTHLRDFALRQEVGWQRKGNALDVDTEVAFLRGWKIGSNPELEIQLHVTAQPTVGHRISVEMWAQMTGITVFNLLRQFSGQPASIHEIGATLRELPV